jgi:hypothetical protein
MPPIPPDASAEAAEPPEGMAGFVAAAFSCAIIASIRLLSIPPIFMSASQTNGFRLSE